MPRGKPLPQEIRDRILHLSSVEGWPTAEISATLGVSRQSAYDYGARGAGKEWNKVARWAIKNHRRLWEELQR